MIHNTCSNDNWERCNQNKYVACELRTWILESDSLGLNADLDTQNVHNLGSHKHCISVPSSVQRKQLCPLAVHWNNAYSPLLLPISIAILVPLTKRCHLTLLPLSKGWPSDSFGEQNTLEVTWHHLVPRPSRKGTGSPPPSPKPLHPTLDHDASIM